MTPIIFNGVNMRLGALIQFVLTVSLFFGPVVQAQNEGSAGSEAPQPVESASSSAAAVASEASSLPEDISDLTLEDLMAINVQAATKSDVSMFEAPVSVSVVTRADIERIPARSFPEVLRSVAGLHLVTLQSSQTMVASRGSNVFTPAKILVLIDGQPIDTTIFSTTWWDLVPVSVRDIERIEVIRSPGTIYGENAQNGVINVITKTNRAVWQQGHNTQAEVRWGEHGYKAAYAGYLYGSEDKKLKVRGSVEASELDPFQVKESKTIIPNRPVNGEQRFVDDQNPQIALQKVSLGASYAVSDKSTLDFSGAFNHIDGARGRVPDRLCFVELTGHTAFSNLRYTHIGDSTEHQVYAGFNENLFTFTKNSTTSYSVVSTPLNEAGMTNTRWNFGYELKLKGTNQNFLIGLNPTIENAKNKSGVAFLTTEKVENEFLMSVPLQYQWDITTKDRLIVGGLYSLHYVADSNFAPMVAFTHRFNENYLGRVGVYTSHRNPNVFEHSMDYDQTSGEAGKRTTMRSNRNLKAERTISYEAGVRAQPTRSLGITLDGFYQEVSDGIEWQLVGVNTGPTRPIYQSVNSLDQKIYGVEFETDYRFTSNLSSGFNITATQVKNETSLPEYRENAAGRIAGQVNTFGEGRYGDDYFPSYTYKVFANYRWSRVNSRLEFHHVDHHNWAWPGFTNPNNTFSSKPVEAYQLLNASVTFNAFENASVTLEGLNLLDSRHTEWRGDESFFGRVVWLRLNASL